MICDDVKCHNLSYSYSYYQSTKFEVQGLPKIQFQFLLKIIKNFQKKMSSFLKYANILCSPMV